MKEFVIRKVEEKELQELAVLADKLWHQAYGNLLSPGQIDYMVQKFQSVEAFKQQLAQGYTYLGVFSDGVLKGYAGSVVHEDRIFLSKLYLDKSVQKKGLSRRLMEKTAKLYPELRSIYLTVNKYNPSYNIYRHLGFKVIDSVVTDIGEGYVMDDYVMQLDY